MKVTTTSEINNAGDITVVVIYCYLERDNEKFLEFL